jgi:hypothetical protein
MSYFVPYVQEKIHRELLPGDFVRVQGKNYIIDEVRRFRRPYTFTTTTTQDLTELTGSMTKRYQHVDKFAVSPGQGVTCTVALTYRGVDVTGLQYAHTWSNLNANVLSPNELDINSFTREDIIRLVITYTAGAPTATIVWFSGEEYSLVEYPTQGDKTAELPERFVIVHPYGFSRVVTSQEYVKAELTGRLRT